MSESYRLSKANVQSTYETLWKLARSYDTAKVDETELVDADFGEYKQLHGTEFSVELRDESGHKVEIKDPEIIKKLFWQLVQCDREPCDKKIDKVFLGKDIRLEWEPPVPAFDRWKQATLYELYKNSVFIITPRFQTDFSESPGVIGWICARTENDDGTFDYIIVTQASLADPYYRNELSYDLVSQAGEYSFANAELFGSDEYTNLAFLKLSHVSADLPVLPLADVKGVSYAQPLYRICEIPTLMTVVDRTTGFSSYNNGFFTTALVYPHTVFRFQVNGAPINQVERGAPLFNVDGQVVGLSGASLADPEEFRYGYFAKTIQNSLKAVLTSPDASFHHNDFGLIVQSIGYNETLRSSLPEDLQHTGVLIANVFTGSAAAAAGLRAGDILIAIDGDTSTTQLGAPEELSAFYETLLEKPSSVETQFFVYRPDTKERLTFAVQPQTITTAHREVYETNYGFSVINIPQAYNPVFQLPNETKGVFTITMAGDEEILNGDIEDYCLITAVNGQAVANVADFKKEFEAALQSGEPIRLTKQSNSYTFTPAAGGVGAISYVVIVP